MELVARLKSLATDRLQQLLVVLASVALVVATGWLLARLVWLVVEGPPQALPAVAAPAAQSAAPRRQYQPDAARDWRLFGDAAAPVVAGQAETAPDTSLSLQLLGTFSTGNDRLAGAVIAERGKDGELYRIGASVPGGAVVEKVESDRVLLRRRGQLETLRFDAIASAGGGAATDDPLRAGMDALSGFRNVRGRLSKPPEDDGDDSGDALSKARSLLGSLQEDLASNPQGVLDELGLKPAPGSGYLVGEGSNAEAMRNLGLRPGDVVLSVNGKPLGNVQNDARMIDEVKASGEARVEVRRGSQTFTVNYPL